MRTLLFCRDEQTQLNAAAAEVTGEVAGEMDINEALRRVLKAAIVADGLVRGLREAAKALDKRQAHLCILATNCQEPLYIKLVEALCSEHNIPLLKVKLFTRLFLLNSLKMMTKMLPLLNRMKEERII